MKQLLQFHLNLRPIVYPPAARNNQKSRLETAKIQNCNFNSKYFRRIFLTSFQEYFFVKTILFI